VSPQQDSGLQPRAPHPAPSLPWIWMVTRTFPHYLQGSRLPEPYPHTHTIPPRPVPQHTRTITGGQEADDHRTHEPGHAHEATHTQALPWARPSPSSPYYLFPSLLSFPLLPLHNYLWLFSHVPSLSLDLAVMSAPTANWRPECHAPNSGQPWSPAHLESQRWPWGQVLEGQS
jgi:hypothetical protein